MAWKIFKADLQQRREEDQGERERAKHPSYEVKDINNAKAAQFIIGSIWHFHGSSGVVM